MNVVGQVLYVDYGTVLWVKEDNLRALEPRFTMLPIQGVLCTLAGVMQHGDSARWVRAKRALSDLVQDRELDAHVIARDAAGGLGALSDLVQDRELDAHVM
ncbi:Tudor domain containing 1 [Operophtera brumata]|uniref:Tudor domain containing 1 n=1 Tax=Operophtera brumata TaxID=104452 RepID=A0A0L7LJL8_OPEBR|nr:Tudor domain containing 1 [Operophtera brumata]